MPAAVPTRSGAVRIFRHEGPDLCFELAFGAPHESLRAYVREYVGWEDRSPIAVRRRELPSGIVPLIINFDSVVRERRADWDVWRTHRSFTAGLHETYTCVEATGPGHGLQVNFTPLGARLFYDRPLVELANETIELDNLLGPVAQTLRSRLFDAPSWEQRFCLLDREIGARIQCGRPLPKPVTSVWAQLAKSSGSACIADLVRATGWSERHLVAQFRQNIGVGPKSFARILRFRHAVRLMTQGQSGSLADIAHRSGYYDQAHFDRDFRAFAGVSPSTLLRNRLPEHSGFRSDT